MERRRRERINSSLEQLAVLLKEANLVAKDKPLDKLEKADILELTVRHVKDFMKSSEPAEHKQEDDRFHQNITENEHIKMTNSLPNPIHDFCDNESQGTRSNMNYMSQVRNDSIIDSNPKFCANQYISNDQNSYLQKSLNLILKTEKREENGIRFSSDGPQEISMGNNTSDLNSMPSFSRSSSNVTAIQSPSPRDEVKRDEVSLAHTTSELATNGRVDSGYKEGFEMCMNAIVDLFNRVQDDGKEHIQQRVMKHLTKHLQQLPYKEKKSIIETNLQQSQPSVNDELSAKLTGGSSQMTTQSQPVNFQSSRCAPIGTNQPQVHATGNNINVLWSINNQTNPQITYTNKPSASTVEHSGNLMKTENINCIKSCQINSTFENSPKLPTNNSCFVMSRNNNNSNNITSLSPNFSLCQPTTATSLLPTNNTKNIALQFQPPSTNTGNPIKSSLKTPCCVTNSGHWQVILPASSSPCEQVGLRTADLLAISSPETWASTANDAASARVVSDVGNRVSTEPLHSTLAKVSVVTRDLSQLGLAAIVSSVRNEGKRKRNLETGQSDYSKALEETDKQASSHSFVGDKNKHQSSLKISTSAKDAKDINRVKIKTLNAFKKIKSCDENLYSRQLSSSDKKCDPVTSRVPSLILQNKSTNVASGSGWQLSMKSENIKPRLPLKSLDNILYTSSSSNSSRINYNLAPNFTSNNLTLKQLGVQPPLKSPPPKIVNVSPSPRLVPQVAEPHPAVGEHGLDGPMWRPW